MKRKKKRGEGESIGRKSWRRTSVTRVTCTPRGITPADYITGAHMFLNDTGRRELRDSYSRLDDSIVGERVSAHFVYTLASTVCATNGVIIIITER